MKLKEIKGILIDFYDLIPNLLLLAQEREGDKKIEPCGNKLCWCGSITFEVFKDNLYAMLWYNVGNSTKLVKMKVGD